MNQTTPDLSPEAGLPKPEFIQVPLRPEEAVLGLQEQRAGPGRVGSLVPGAAPGLLTGMAGGLPPEKDMDSVSSHGSKAV